MGGRRDTFSGGGKLLLGRENSTASPETLTAMARGTGGHSVEYSKGSWDGRTVKRTFICKRDRWTSCGLSHCHMGSWDRIDILQHF